MILGIDHLVIAVRDPDAAARVLEQDLGLACTGGGRHEAMGTYNRLSFLGDTYLELIGIFDRDLVLSSSTFAVGNAALAFLEDRGEGLATYALATNDVAGDVARLQAAGAPIGAPVAGSRLRPDGETVRWVTAFPQLGPERPPFLIEHETAGTEWGAEARAAREAYRHPAGGSVRLASLELPVSDVPAAAREYGSVLGIAFSEGWRTIVGAQSVALRESPGGQPLVELRSEAASAPLDLVRFGVRWRRIPVAA